MSCGVALLAFVASGCSSTVGDDAVSPSSTSGPPSALAFDDDAGLPESIDLAMVEPMAGPPSQVSLADQGAVIVADLLYDGLTEAVGTEGRLAPGLATSWEANADLTEWTFSIDTARIAPSTVVDHFVAVTGDSSQPAIGGALDSVIAVELIDETDVRFTLSQPEAALPWLLSGVGASVMGDEGATTGPYVVASRDNNGMVLQAASVDSENPTIVVSWADTPRDAYDQLTLGLVDGAVAPASVLDDAANRFGLDPQARSLSRFYVLNGSSGNLTDERVREAIRLAVDRHVIAEDHFSGPVVAADGVVGPTTAGYRRDVCGDVCEFDGRQAVTLVAELRAEGVLPGSLTIAYSGAEQAVPAAALVESLSGAGFEAVAVDYGPEALASAIVNGEADLFAYGVVPVAGSIDAIVPKLFASQSPLNLTGVASEEIDDLIAEAATTADDDLRWEILGQAHELGLDDGRILPLAVAKSHLILNPQTSGLIIRADGSIDLKVEE